MIHVLAHALTTHACVFALWGGFTLGVRAFEAWLYTFMPHKSH